MLARRTVSVEDGHIVALPDGFQLPPAGKADLSAAPALSGDLDKSVADIARLDLTAVGGAQPSDGEAQDSPATLDKSCGEAATNGASRGYVQVVAVV